MVIYLYAGKKLRHKLETNAQPWELGDLLVDERGRYWMRMQLGSSYAYKLVEPVSIDTRGRMGEGLMAQGIVL